MKLVLGLFLGLSISAFSYAGNGSSGGGHIYGDKLNPWFLHNTTTVNYCVEIAPEFSQLTREEVLTIVEKSFLFWKSSFKNYNASYYTLFQNIGQDVKLGTQNFVLEDQCSKTTDLKFQFGFLTDDQKKELDYKQLIGLAERTEYDSVNLKAKGFIYIAAETGEFRPTSSQFHATPWSYGKKKILQFVLHHELGHIFGLQDGFYDDAGLMDAHIAETLTSKTNIKWFDSQLSTPSVFGCDDRLESQFVINYEHTNTVYQKNTGIDLLNAYLGLTSKRYTLQFTSTATDFSIRDLTNKREIGKIHYKMTQVSDNNHNNAISVYLTKAQNVFAKLPASYFFNSYIPIYVRTTSKGFKNEELELTNGNKMNVFIKFDAECLGTVGGMFNNEIYFDLFSGL